MKNKPKVLFVMHMPPPVHGAAMMGQYVHDSDLINEKFECHYINPSLSISVGDVGKFSLKKLLIFFRTLFKVYTTIKRLKPELCYYTATTNGYGICREALMILTLKIARQKILLHLHNKGVREFSKKPFTTLPYKIMFSKVKVILLAKELYADVQKFVQKEDIYYCPNGIPITNFDNYRRTLTNDPYTFLFLSNMIEEKGVVTLLEACAVLSQKGISYKCNFVGKWSNVTEERFNNLIKELGISDSVRYLGAKYGNDKISMLKNADSLVFPTFYQGETFGLVLLEAMEYGMPCISTFEGGIPSVLDDNKTGFLVQARDVQTLAEKMQWLVNNPDEGLKMGDLGRQKFLKEFTLDKFEKHLCDILDKEVKRPR